MTLRRVAWGVVVATVLAACAGTSGASVAEPDSLCPPPDFEVDGAVDVAARCRRVLTLADERLGVLHWPVTDVDVRWNLCPPGARCVFLQLSQAWVIYRFSMGDPVMIHVRPSAPDGDFMIDNLVAGDPEPLPDWLLEELDAEAPANQGPIGRGPGV